MSDTDTRLLIGNNNFGTRPPRGPYAATPLLPPKTKPQKSPRFFLFAGTRSSKLLFQTERTRKIPAKPKNPDCSICGSKDFESFEDLFRKSKGQVDSKEFPAT